MKKAVYAVLIALAMICLVSCGGSDKKSAKDTVEITWWIPKAEDSTYYMSYEENPGVRQLETMEFNGHKVSLKFTVPISGSERDNFNTLMMTEDYKMIFDMSFCTSSPMELLEDGVIWDLTPYMEEYMPHYMQIIKSDESLAPYVYNSVDGEKKILSLYSITNETLGNFMGLNYRRDWVAKYGTNPKTGAKNKSFITNIITFFNIRIISTCNINHP